MEKILTLLTFSVTLNVLAQNTILLTDMGSNTVVPANAVLHVKSKAQDEVKSHFDIKNTSSVSTNVYNVKRYNFVLHTLGIDQAEAYFCFAGTCNPTLTPVGALTATLNPNQSTSQIIGNDQTLSPVLLEFAPVVGLSIVRYTVFNVNNPSDSLQFTIRYSDPVLLGLKNETRMISKAEMSPNPAVNGHTVLRVSSSTAFTSRLSIINSIGQVVSEKDVDLNASLNKIDVETSGLQAGVYFVRLSGNNETVTRRLIVE